MTKPLTAIQKWEKRIFPEPNSGCHIWMGYLNPDGYGQTTLFASKRGRCSLAHRVSWKLFKGTIPDGLGVLHQCDNPACVNPDHLFIGDQAANMADMARKKRWGGPRNLPKGFLHPRPRAKLTGENIKAILGDNRLQSQIAKEYGVHPSTISNLKRGKSYAPFAD